jgi:Pyruvate/2-oxoacid:ferredoxin oxidoreductase delta subunit
LRDEVYLRLREFMDTLPGGYPTTESGVEMRILRKLFSPEEAEMVMRLSSIPETAEAVAQREGLEVSETARMIESMAGKGLLFRMSREGEVLYSAFQFIFGVYDFQVNAIDGELAQMMEEYFPYLDVIEKQFRVVPVASAVDTTMNVSTYDRIRDLVKKEEIISVSPCICRREQGLLGHECERPSETCLGFGLAAEYRLENDIGRRISKEETLEILDLAEKSALVLCPTNSRDIVFVCCCCGCCCGMLGVLKTEDRPADKIRSPYRAKVDSDLCNACGNCLERCQMNALVEDDNVMEVDAARCIGCGLCVDACQEKAIYLEENPKVTDIASNVGELLMDIAAQRGIA